MEDNNAETSLMSMLSSMTLQPSFRLASPSASPTASPVADACLTTETQPITQNDASYTDLASPVVEPIRSLQSSNAVVHTPEPITLRLENFTPVSSSNSTGSFFTVSNDSTTATSPLKPRVTGTLLVYPSLCGGHDTGSHQESKERLKVLCGEGGVLRQENFAPLHWSTDSLFIKSRIQIADILRVHDQKYWQHIESKCRGVGGWGGVPGGPQDPLDLNKFDFDTILSEGTMDAMLSAAGAVIHAIDEVASGKVRNAFCATRPPGHHAGSRGAVPAPNFAKCPEMCSSGFCFLNNAAIGAAYARATYGRGNPNLAHAASIRRIAIVDWDIHHGNGTEEIIKNLLPSAKGVLPLPESWAPMTYDAYKPWLDGRDADDVLFASIHLVKDGFYPNDGFHSVERPRIINIPMHPVGKPTDKIEAKSKTAKQMAELHKKASKEFRDGLSLHLFPHLESFHPDIIMISAGFDGHQSDFYYHLDESDYAWATTQLMDIADRQCAGRVVSILEGGYHVEEETPSPPPVTSTKRATRGNEGKNKDVDGKVEGRGGSSPLLSPLPPPQVKQHSGLARCVEAHVTALMKE